MVVVAATLVVQLTTAPLEVIPDVEMLKKDGGAESAQVVPAVVIVYIVEPVV